MRLILVLAALVAPSVAAADELALICKGDVTTTETSTASSMEPWNGKMDHYPQLKTARVERQVTKPGQYRIRIKDGAGEVISGVSGNHYPIEDLVLGEREISGRLNRGGWPIKAFSKLTVDRQTGDMRISGLFTGSCEKGPAEDAPNKF